MHMHMSVYMHIWRLLMTAAHVVVYVIRCSFSLSICRALRLPHRPCCYGMQGQLPLQDIEARARQFDAAGVPLMVTSVPLLVDKARLLPGSIFVVRKRHVM